MARKSRNIFDIKKEREISIETVTSDEICSDGKLLTAAYIRLSAENGGHRYDSDTLDTQLDLVKEYIRNDDTLNYIGEYIDNGYTGTNFDRPEFIRLMNDVREGRVQCIVVKDLSRFGRNYLETGYYLENIFPKLGVRFISITDNFDSAKNDDISNISVPVKNIVNGYYAKDISQKLCTAFEVKKRSGKIMSTAHPYGYTVKGEETRYSIDEEAAQFVRMIFEWTVMGKNPEEIAKRLNLIGAMTPNKRHTYLRTGEICDDGVIWCRSSVKKIILNPVYTGDLYTGKSKSAFYKDEKYRDIDRSKWFKTANTHPALVAKDDYAVIEKRHEDNKTHYRTSRERTVEIRERLQVFQGMVYCAKCRKRMTFNRKFHKLDEKKELYTSYSCEHFKTADGHTNFIYENTLKVLVMDQIQNLLQNMCGKAEILEEFKNSGKGKIGVVKRQIENLAQRVNIVGNRKEKLYENYASGVITYEEYRDFKERYICESEELNNKRREMERELNLAIKEQESIVSDLNDFERYIGKRIYDQRLVDKFIERIYVDSDSIEIVFKCGDISQRIEKLLATEE